MDLLTKDVLKIDTRASPTGEGKTADVEFHGQDLFDHMTQERGTPTTRQDDRASTLEAIPTSSATSSIVDESASSALAQATELSTLSGVAILSIIFGSIVAVVFVILAVVCIMRRSKRNRMRNRMRDHDLTQPSDRPAATERQRSGER